MIHDTKSREPQEGNPQEVKQAKNELHVIRQAGQRQILDLEKRECNIFGSR